MLCFRSDIEFDLSLYLEEPPLSRRFPTNVIVHYRVPEFSTLDEVYNITVIDSQYTEPTAIGQYGLEFKVGKPTRLYCTGAGVPGLAYLNLSKEHF